MTQDEIIEMARQAGLFIAHDSEGQFSAVHDGEILDMYPDGDKERDRLYREKRFVEILGPFAKLVAASEREACAMVCDELQAPPHVSDDDMSMWDVTSMECADAIRARGEALASPIIESYLKKDNLEEALAEQPAPVQQEPVAWLTQARCFVDVREYTESEAKRYGWNPLYTSPSNQPGYQAMAMAVTRLQKRCSELERKQPAQLPAPVQHDPVAWIEHHKGGDNLEWDYPGANSSPLYTAPPQRTWIGLSLTEQADCFATTDNPNDFYKAIEARLKELNT